MAGPTNYLEDPDIIACMMLPMPKCNVFIKKPDMNGKVLRISEILVHVKNKRHGLQFWKMKSGMPGLIDVLPGTICGDGWFSASPSVAEVFVH
jgi:hypothetical protein